MPTLPRVVGLVILGIGIAFAVPAWGHGENQWIMDGKYKAIDGRHCCGPDDCIPRTFGQVHRRPGGSYLVEMPNGLMTVPKAAVYQGRDPFWRACTPGCLFRPWSGS